MPLDPQAAALLKKVAELNFPEYWELGPEGARASHERNANKLGASFESVFKCEDREVPGPEVTVPIRIYTPRESDLPLPVMVWFHGGGHVIGSLDSYDHLCRHLALKSDAIVVSVGYRLAPENKFPAAVIDSFSALTWAAKHAEEFGGDPSRIAVSGDSAGGNLAAVCALLARDEGYPHLCFQLLIYPATAAHADSESQMEFATDHLLTRNSILWFHSSYIRDDEDRKDFRYAPLIAESHANLPPTRMILAECDPLRDEGIAYAKALEAAGNDVVTTVYSGMIHPFFSMPGVFDAAHTAIDEAARAASQAFQESALIESTHNDGKEV